METPLNETLGDDKRTALRAVGAVGKADVALAVDEPFSFVEHRNLLIAIAQALRCLNPSCLHAYPSRSDAKAIFLEPLNLIHCLTGRGAHVLDRTALPGLYRLLLRFRSRRLADSLRLFVASQAAGLPTWRSLLGGELVAPMINAGLLIQTHDGWSSRLRIVPVYDRLFLTDAIHRSTGQTIWLGKDSIILLDALRRRLAGTRFRLGLEIGCGSGIVTSFLADFCEHSIGTDINPRALDCAGLNAEVNHIENVEFRLSNLYEHLPEAFDVIVSNPPHVFVPPEKRRTAIYADGGEDYGVDIPLAICEGLPQRLAAGGLALLLAGSPVVHGVDILPDRLRRRFSEAPLAFELQPLFNVVSAEHLAYHRACGVAYVWSYLVTVTRATSFSLQIKPPSRWVRAKSWVYRQLVTLGQGTRLENNANS